MKKNMKDKGMGVCRRTILTNVPAEDRTKVYTYLYGKDVRVQFTILLIFAVVYFTGWIAAVYFTFDEYRYFLCGYACGNGVMFIMFTAIFYRYMGKMWRPPNNDEMIELGDELK